MRVLIIKTSSMGDILHTLPALTDAGRALPDIRFDWVVEEAFAEIPAWHPLVDKVIPVAWRRWRKHLSSVTTWKEILAFRKQLRAEQYDMVIDAQGLIKSAFITSQARGKRVGLDAKSAREAIAARFYQQGISVSKKQHAITRVRQLFSQALGYKKPIDTPDFGLNRAAFVAETSQPYIVFLHGTTWPTKHWPESSWLELAKIAVDKGFVVKLPWGNAAELERAERVASISSNIQILPRLDLKGIAGVLAGAKAVVAVDTGLLHLTAALKVPAVSLFGPTNPELSGPVGPSQKPLAVKFSCAPCLSRECKMQDTSLYPLKPPCFTTLPPIVVWSELMMLLIR